MSSPGATAVVGAPVTGRWGRRMQRLALSYLIGANARTPDEVIRCKFLGNPGPSRAILYSWKCHFEEWMEPPVDTAKYLKQHAKTWRMGSTTPRVVKLVKAIVDREPELYLDEIQTRVQQTIGVSPSLPTISRILNQMLRYSLRVITEKATQRDCLLRDRFRRDLVFFSDPALFCWVDETHKDRNASRRRRAWGPRGEDNCVSRFFAGAGTDVLYSLLAAADINGFVTSACEIVEKAQGSDMDSTHGTVDADRFVDWVENYLCPTLGSYTQLEPRSVVVMDNCTLHHDPRVLDLIRSKGAILLYTSPYSPDLNVIERCFRQYKAYLKRHPTLTKYFPRWLHTFALRTVTRENMLAYYHALQCLRNVPVSADNKSTTAAVYAMLGSSKRLRIA